MLNYQILDSNAQDHFQHVHVHVHFENEQMTKLSNEQLKTWKISIKANLLSRLKLMYFSNPFGVTFILDLNFPSFCLIRCAS